MSLHFIAPFSTPSYSRIAPVRPVELRSIFRSSLIDPLIISSRWIKHVSASPGVTCLFPDKLDRQIRSFANTTRECSSHLKPGIHLAECQLSGIIARQLRLKHRVFLDSKPALCFYTVFITVRLFARLSIKLKFSSKPHCAFEESRGRKVHLSWENPASKRFVPN